MKRVLAILMLALCGASANAIDLVLMTDVSKLSWQAAPDGRVYFRNFNQYNGNFLGCCYNFYLDITTSTGKAEWAAILLKMSGAQPLYFAVDSATTPGPVTYIGNW